MRHQPRQRARLPTTMHHLLLPPQGVHGSSGQGPWARCATRACFFGTWERGDPPPDAWSPSGFERAADVHRLAWCQTSWWRSRGRVQPSRKKKHRRSMLARGVIDQAGVTANARPIDVPNAGQSHRIRIFTEGGGCGCVCVLYHHPHSPCIGVSVRTVCLSSAIVRTISPV